MQMDAIALSLCAHLHRAGQLLLGGASCLHTKGADDFVQVPTSEALRLMQQSWLVQRLWSPSARRLAGPSAAALLPLSWMQHRSCRQPGILSGMQPSCFIGNLNSRQTAPGGKQYALHQSGGMPDVCQQSWQSPETHSSAGAGQDSAAAQAGTPHC